MIERAVNAVIRPPRMDYDDLEIPLVVEADDGRTFIRYPATFRNQRGETLVGSIYHAIDRPPFDGGPCVVYLHGNASSQLEGQFLVPNLCPLGIFVFCFDFAGCGCSGGKYVSLGWFEREDTEFLLNILHRTFHLGPFVLWGRSMGAATALLVKSPLLVGRVIDSAFTSVRDMCSAVAVSMKLPKVFVPAAMWFLKKKVLSAAKFNFDEVAPINVDNEGTEVPAVFGHAEKDQFIPFEQCKRLYEHYQNSSKYLMVLPGGHNSKRKIEWIQLGVFFCLEQFHINPDDVQISECRRLQESTFHFTSFEDMVGKATDGAVTGEEIQKLVNDEAQVEKMLEEVEEPKRKRKKRRHHKAGEDDAGNGEKKRKHRRHRNKEKQEKKEEVERPAYSDAGDSAPATSDDGDNYSAMASQDVFDLEGEKSESEEDGKVIKLARTHDLNSDEECLTRSEEVMCPQKAKTVGAHDGTEAQVAASGNTSDAETTEACGHQDAPNSERSHEQDKPVVDAQSDNVDESPVEHPSPSETKVKDRTGEGDLPEEDVPTTAVNGQSEQHSSPSETNVEGEPGEAGIHEEDIPAVDAQSEQALPNVQNEAAATESDDRATSEPRQDSLGANGTEETEGEQPADNL